MQGCLSLTIPTLFAGQTPGNLVVFLLCWTSRFAHFLPQLGVDDYAWTKRPYTIVSYARSRQNHDLKELRSELHSGRCTYEKRLRERRTGIRPCLARVLKVCAIKCLEEMNLQQDNKGEVRCEPHQQGDLPCEWQLLWAEGATDPRLP